MRVDIFSDVVCPWCYIGKRRFEAAMARFDHGDEVQLTWRSFELDPTTPRSTGAEDYVQSLATKLGMSRTQAEEALARMTDLAAQDALEYHFDIASPANTFDAHRLLHASAADGIQDELKERLFRANFTEGRRVDDLATLRDVAVEAGMSKTTAGQVLESDAFAADVRADQEQARRYGISGVPFYVVDNKYGISGAQPVEAILQTLEGAWREHDSSAPIQAPS